MTEVADRDAFDQWWEWANKPLDSPLTERPPSGGLARRNPRGGRMADAKTAIESMNRRLLIAEGQVTALKEMVHLLVDLARTTNPNLTYYLHEAKRTLDAIEVPDEQTSTYLNAAAGLIAEVIDAKDEPPKFAVIDGGKSDDPV